MKKNGFTLLEIVVAVSLLAIIGALASRAVMSSVKKSRIKQAESELQILGAAILQLAWDTGKWPNGEPRNNIANAEIWDLSDSSKGLTGNRNGTFPDWKGPYYGGQFTDPWGKPYFFDPDYSHEGKTRIVVGSFGPNRSGRNVYDSDNIYVLLDD
jgi:general secretion pathway protein G